MSESMLKKQIPHQSPVWSLILLLSFLTLFAIVPMVHGQDFTINAGESQSAQFKACMTCYSGSCAGYGAQVQANAQGDAAGWVSPSYFDFGDIAFGVCSYGDYTISVPSDTPSGTYTLEWYETCQADSGGSCSPYTWTYTIAVNGVENTTTETTTVNETTTINYATTINYVIISQTTTISPGHCPAGEIEGGLPSSPICYPPGIQVAESGSVSIVDLSGMPTSSFVVDSVALTQAGSYLYVNYPGYSYSLTLYPSTVAGQVEVEGTSSGFSTDATSSYFDTLDAQGVKLGMHIYGEATLHTALEVLAAEAGMGALSTTLIATPFTMIMVGRGEIEYLHNTLQEISWVAKCSASPAAMACSSPTNPDPTYRMSVGDNGTTLTALNGSILVSSLSATGTTPKYITLFAGQQLFIPNNSVQANQQNLGSSIKTSTQSTTSSIPPSLNNTGSSGTGTAIVVIFIMIIFIALLLHWRRKE